MRNKLLILSLVVFAFGCNSDIKKENETLKKENEKLKAQQKKSVENSKVTIEWYQRALKEIDNNLNSIETGSQKLNQLKEVKTDGNRKKNIMERIKEIRESIGESREQLINLDRSLKSLRKENGDQSEEILMLSRELKEKTKELLEKEMELIKLSEEMQLAYEQKENENKELKDIINRAYYFVGTAKELKKQNIVNAGGGFIGISKAKVINANSDNSLFTKIGKEDTDSINLAGKTIKMITQHPDGSYELKEDGDKTVLMITDKEKFWKNSNYLVIQLN